MFLLSTSLGSLIGMSSLWIRACTDPAMTRECKELQHRGRACVFAGQRLQLPYCFQGLQQRIVAMLDGGLEALSYSGTCPNCIDMVVGVWVVSFVKGDEEGCFLVGEEFACENLRDHAGEVVVSCRNGAVVQVVTEVRG